VNAWTINSELAVSVSIAQG